jgi:hypothetical protein
MPPEGVWTGTPEGTIAAMQAAKNSKSGFAVAIWHRPGERPPEKLLAALKSRGIGIVEVQSAYGALAEVCQRLDLAAEAGKRQFGVVAVYPERLEDPAILWDALARYAPGTRCWAYGPAGDANPKLAPIVEKKPENPSDASPAERPPESRARSTSALGGPVRLAGAAPGQPARTGGGLGQKVVEPKLKLTGPSAGPAGGTRTAPLDMDAAGADFRLMEDEESGSPRAPLLSPEELSMLLGDDDNQRD